MGGAKNVIDYRDLNIPLADGTQGIFKIWLDFFEEAHDYVEISPRIRNGNLQINSTDLISLTGYIEPETISEVELLRFKKNAGKELDQRLLRSTSSDHQAHYKWCMAAIKSKKFGRFRHEANDDQIDKENTDI